MKQNIAYGIYIVEQLEDDPFNRAALLNIGFKKAMADREWDCAIFHDIDLIPMDDRILYTCPSDQPKHLSVSIDAMDFK